MRQIFKYILKRGFYAALKNNFIQKTPEKHYEDLKMSIAYGVSFSLIYMPLGAIVKLILKLSGGNTHIPKSTSILFAFASIPIIVYPVRRYLNSISLTELIEEDEILQKKLSTQYTWVVLSILGLMILWMFLIRVTYLSLR
jgi:hypothetical protein